ncbi:hypothetical protein [Streptomyces sp. NPDC088254]|uniref:hypothetical protein n=1 Tax=Streptomyces sp. NPDC088254 TaxID=3365847 RepID=UPI00380523CF
MRDASAYAPDAAKPAGPWRDLGRTDLIPELLGARLEEYVTEASATYGTAVMPEVPVAR